MELSILDQTSPHFYIRQLFCFEFDHRSTGPALYGLHHALEAPIAQWPVLAGMVIPGQDPDSKHNLKSVRYQTPLPRPLYGTHLFAMQWLSANYQELLARGMPQSELKTGSLSSLPWNSKPGQAYPVFGLQVNFLEGGLILCFTLSHTVLDGVSKDAIFECFGRNMRMDTPTFKNLHVQSREFVDLCRSKSTNINVHTCPEYRYDNTPPPPLTRQATGRVFVFDAHRIAELKDSVMKYLQTTASDAWASTSDCLCALLWVSVMQVRARRLSPSTNVKFSQSVNARRQFSLPQSYFGNAFLQPFASARLGDLLNSSETDCLEELPDDLLKIATVAKAALNIRAAIQEVDKDYAQQRLDLWASLQDPSSTLHAFWRALDMPDTGIFLSSWVNFGADVDFAIPGTTTGCAQYVRKPWSASEGACNILPRKGGTKGDADWEVLVQLSVEDMERLCVETEFGRLANKVIE
ncbi:transferase family-domain-containing protein [Phyllosticta capitalensis]|uniref:Transferase family-domain-containing protein n=1 Tax=Phyllosticta capitalensis TaxID=121624 RepID=A0ABR1YN15_9PEZI